MTSTQPLDLGDKVAVKAWIDEAARAHGGIGILHNNAGATRFDPIEEESYEDWKSTLRSELDVVFPACEHARTHLRARGVSSVINIGSTAGLAGSLTLDWAAHTASKGGVMALTRQLAAERARHGIRVLCISPGMILSPATSGPIFNNPQHPMYRIRDHIPLGRVGEPKNVARCALFLASDDSYDRCQRRARRWLVECAARCVAPGRGVTARFTSRPQVGCDSIQMGAKVKR